MREIILEPRKYAKGKYLRVNFITVEWDRERRAFAAIVMFHRTRDRQDNKRYCMPTMRKRWRKCFRNIICSILSGKKPRWKYQSQGRTYGTPRIAPKYP